MPSIDRATETLTPPDLAVALEKAGLTGAFAALPPSHRREYLTWIDAAKTAATRARRIAKTIEMLGGRILKA